MAGTISFSGLSSGVDTSGWVDALVSVKQETVTSLQTKQAEQEKLLSIVNEIKSYFTSFQSCLQKITDAQFGVTSMDLFAQNLAISSNSNVVTATATTEAARQSYDVVVDKLATATKATSGYSQYEVKTATLDTTFGTLGGTNGTVTVNQQSFIVTTDDTLRTIIEKFKNVGVDAKFDENTGKFSLSVSVGEIDEGATNLKGALRLKDNNVDGATSGSLMYATRETEFSKLGLTAGKVNIEGESHTITKNGDNYTISKTGGASHSLNTIGDFLDYLLTDAVNAESANIDDKGNIAIMGATMDPVSGGSNILDVLNLTESDDRIVVESDKLSYIEVRAADLNTQLSQLGINADTTLTVGGTTHTITNDKTLGDVKALLNAGGVDLSVDSNGLLTIDTNGNEISGTLLDVLGLDPTKNGTTITSSVHNSAFDATKNTVLSDLGVNNSHNYTAYKSDGTALNTPTSNLMNKTIEELIADLRALGLDASFDEDTKKITIKDGYIEGTLADQLGMTEEETSYTEAATGETTLEKLGATGNQTLSIDGGAAVTYGKDTTLETIINDLEAAGAEVTFKNGNLTVQGVTLGGTLPALLGLDATTQGTTVTSGNLSVVTNNTSTGTNQTETVENDLSLTSKIGDITGTTANYTLGINGGTAQTFSMNHTLGDVKALIEGAGGTFIINDDNSITVTDVTMTGTLVGAFGFDAVDEGTKFTTVDPVYVTGTSNVAQGDTTLGELGVVVQTFGLTPVAGATLSIDGGAEKTYDATTTLDDIFDDIRAAGGTASVDSDGYIVIEGVNLSGTVVDALGLEATANRTTITSGDLKVTTSTKATSSSALQGVSAGNITGDSTIGSITGDTNSYNLSINGAAATTYTTGTKLSAIQTAISNAGGTMTINADNTITVSGVELNGTLLDALGFTTTDYKTTITSNTPIYTPGDEVDATASTTFNQLGIATDKRDYAIYANDGTIIQASSTSGTASTKTIGDWLSILNSKLNTANGTSGQTYAKIENGIISITGGYVTGSLPTALGIGIESETIGVTMSGSSITYIESDPLKFIGGVTTGAGQAGSNVDYTGNVTDTTEQEGESAGIANNNGNLTGSVTQEGNAEGDITGDGYVTGTTTQGGTATGDVTVSGDVGTSGTQLGNAEGNMSSTGSIGTDASATGTATGNTAANGTIDDATSYIDAFGNITKASLSTTLAQLLSPTATNKTEDDARLTETTYTLKIGSYAEKTFTAATATLQDVVDYVKALKEYDPIYNKPFDAYIDTSTNKLVIKSDATITGTLADALGLTKNDAATVDEYYTYTASNVTFTDLVEGGTDDGYNFQITGAGKVEYDKEELEGEDSFEYTGEKITYTTPVAGGGDVGGGTPAGPVKVYLSELSGDYSNVKSGDTYYIKTAADMLALASLTDAGKSSGVNFVLENDINLGSNWDPIGLSSSSAFKGSFYGEGHQISFSDVSSDAVNQGIAGLFGYVDSATIKGLKLNVTINNARLGKIGLLAAVISGSTLVQGVITYGTMNVGEDAMSAVGGIVGQAGSSSEIKNVWNQAGINVGATLGGGIGGIVGTSEATIEVAHNTGSIHVDDLANAYVGGIAGIVTEMSSSIKHISNNASIRGTNSVVGGLIGHNEANVSYGICTGTVFGGKSDSNAAVADRLNGSLSEIYYYNSNTPLMSGSSTVGGMIRVGSEYELVSKYNTSQFTQANGWYTPGGVPFAYTDSDSNTMKNNFGYTGSDSSANTTNNGGGASGATGATGGGSGSSSTVTSNGFIGSVSSDSGTGYSASTRLYSINQAYFQDASFWASADQCIDIDSNTTIQDVIDAFGNGSYYDQGSGTIYLKSAYTVSFINSAGEEYLSTNKCSYDHYAFRILKTSNGPIISPTAGGVTYVSEVFQFASGGIYHIETAADLNKLAELVNSGESTQGVSFILDCDIDMSSVSDFAGIGNNTYAFKGSFYGNGHVIKNLTMKADTNSIDVGFFGAYSGPLITDLALENVNISVTSTWSDSAHTIGALVGYMSGSADGGIVNCYATGKIDTGSFAAEHVGGLVGMMNTGAYIECSYADVDITVGTHGWTSSGKAYGGLVGLADEAELITCSYATGDVSVGNGANAQYFLGGLVGRANATIIDSAYATGNVSAASSTAYSGGIVGEAKQSTSIARTYFTGDIGGMASITGGIAGGIDSSVTFTSSNLYYASSAGQGVGKNITTNGSVTSWWDEQLDDLQDQAYMKSMGYTSAYGWEYTYGMTPHFGNMTASGTSGSGGSGGGTGGGSTETHDATLTTTIGELFGDTSSHKLTIQKTGGTAEDLTFATTDTLQTIIDKLIEKGIEATFDSTTGKLTVKDDECWTFSGELAPVLFGGAGNSGGTGGAAGTGTYTYQGSSFTHPSVTTTGYDASTKLVDISGSAIVGTTIKIMNGSGGLLESYTITALTTIAQIENFFDTSGYGSATYYQDTGDMSYVLNNANYRVTAQAIGMDMAVTDAPTGTLQFGVQETPTNVVVSTSSTMNDIGLLGYDKTFVVTNNGSDTTISLTNTDTIQTLVDKLNAISGITAEYSSITGLKVSSTYSDFAIENNATTQRLFGGSLPTRTTEAGGGAAAGAGATGGGSVSSGNVTASGFIRTPEIHTESSSSSSITEGTEIVSILSQAKGKYVKIYQDNGYAAQIEITETTTIGDLVDFIAGEYGNASFNETTRNISFTLYDGFTIESSGIPMDAGSESTSGYICFPTGGTSSVTYVSSVNSFTSGATYHIKTAADLQKLAELVNAGKDTTDVTFILDNDIHYTNSFAGIGNSTYSFNGKFYGNGYAICDMELKNDTTSIIGLFVSIGSEGLVQDLSMKSVSINFKTDTNKSGGGAVGFIAGVNQGTIKNCYVEAGNNGKITTAAHYVGGLVGRNIGGTIEDSYTTGIELAISTYVNSDPVKASGGWGGLVGLNSGTIKTSYAEAKIGTTAKYVGGLVGHNSNGGTIDNAYTSSTITVQGSSTSRAGGFVGNNEGAISHAYVNTTGISGGPGLGGFSGVSGTGTYAGCYYSAPIAAGAYEGSSDAVVAISLTDLKNQTTMEGHGFTATNGWKYTVGMTPHFGNMISTGASAGSTGGAGGTTPAESYTMEQVTTQVPVTNTYTMDENTTIGDLFGDTANHTFTINGEDITLGPDDTVQDLIDQLQDKGYEVLISDGKMTIGCDGTFGSGNSFTVSGDLAEKLLKKTGSVTADYETTDVELSASTKMSDIFWDENNHTFKIDKVSGTDITITLGKDDTIQTLIDKLAENGIVATIDANGKMTFKSNFQWSAAGDVGTLVTNGTDMSKATTYLYTYNTEKLETYTGVQFVSDMSSLVAGNKYHIKSAADLEKLAEFVNGGTDVTGCRFYLDQDVNMSSVADFAGIGTATYAFDAKFYGNGHTISGLKMTSTDENTGLFNVTNGATIVDLGLTGVTISGAADVGALIGDATNTTVTNCYSKGSVTGSGDNVGGLIGTSSGSTLTNIYSTATVNGKKHTGGLIGNLASGTLTKSYATGHITGTDGVGGLIGNVGSATVTHTYATGDVKATATAGIAGGLIGIAGGSTIKISYAIGMVYGTTKGGFIGKIAAASTLEKNVYNSSTEIGKAVGSGSETGISGKTLTDIATKSVMVAAGFKEADGWVYTTGTTPTFGNISVTNSGTVYVKDVTQFDAGNTYFIKDADDLVHLADLVNTQGLDTTGVAFVLEGNVDMDGIDFIPIGTLANTFKGDFYGNGYEIQNLSIDLDDATSGISYVGLFGKVSSSIIRDVNLTDVSIAGKGYVGGLVGYVDSTSSVTNCSVKGTVTGTGDIVGGLVGYNAGTITESYSNATVSGADTVGGFVGANSGGSISKSYATGNVSGTSIVGGFAGVNNSSGTITMAYAKGNVSGTSSVGGFVGGLAAASTTTKSYATGKATGTTNVGAFAGKIVAGATVSGNVANKGSGDAVVNALSVGDGATTGITFAVIEDMRSKTYMEGLGFKATDGWVYSDDASYSGHAKVTPTLGGVTVTGGGQVYVKNLTDFRIGDTYFLKDKDDLNKLAELVNAGKDTTGVVFILENNIDMSTVADFAGIGTATYAFKGDFYGNGKKIIDLTVSSTDDNSGLFNYTNNAKIKDVGLQDVTITGKNSVGALIGYAGSNTEVYNSYVNGGTVSGSGDNVGGLIGNFNGTTLTESYSTAKVSSGGGQAGGLVGNLATGTISKSFATGHVTANGAAVGGLVGNVAANGTITTSYATGDAKGSTYAGGLIGVMGGGTVTNSYATGMAYGTQKAGFIGYVATTSTISGNVYNSSTELTSGASSGVTGLTLTEMATKATMVAQGFTEAAGWKYVDGTTPTLGDTVSVTNSGKVYMKTVTQFDAGNTYYIKDKDDIAKLAELVNTKGLDTTGVFFVLENDIDMTGVTYTPIGTSSNAFKGDFYGNGHEIQNLTIDLDDATTGISYVGLFGKVQSSQIRDVGLTNVNIAGKGYVGGLAGSIDSASSVTNCYVTGTVTGTGNNVGGLLGSSAAEVTQSYSTATVSGKENTGGLVGNNSGEIEKSFALGDVSGTKNVGGLVGTTSGSITISFAKGKVTSTSNGGGFAGNITAGSVTKSYATGDAAYGFAGSIADTGVTILDNVANKGSGDKVVNASAVGTGASTGITLTVIENMRDKSLMESYGIKADDGWTYTDDGATYIDTDTYDDLAYVTPTLGGVKIEGGGRKYVSDLTGFRLGDTYYIKSADDLKKLSELVNAGNDTAGVVFVLENDIDLNSEAFTPIGTSTNKFKGDFYGNGHTISNLKVTATENGAGLFGYASNAKIQDLGLENVDVSGTGTVGALVGSIGEGGEIYNVYATGKVEGSGNYVGGLVGVSGSTKIRDSYTEVTVTGKKYVGGFIGSAAQGTNIDRAYAAGRVYISDSVGGGFAGYAHQATISNVFSTGNVNATANTVKHLGGLIGEVGQATINTVYSTGRVLGTTKESGGSIGKCASNATLTNVVFNSNTELNGIGTNDGTQSVTGKTIIEMTDKTTMEGLGFTTAKGWKYLDDTTPTFGVGTTVVENGGKVYVSAVSEFRAGNTYYISTAADLERLSELVNLGEETNASVFILDNDVDMSSVADFVSIGSATGTAFRGDFYGNGHTISGLKQTGDDAKGLFGKVEKAIIQDVGIVDANITSTANNAGILAENIDAISVVKNVYTTGTISGVNVGGLVSMNNGKISESYSTADVTGTKGAGGLVYHNNLGSTITKSFATGRVYATDAAGIAGGFAAINEQTIESCYALGNVVADGASAQAGGFAGVAAGGKIINSYSTGIVQGTSSKIGGFAGFVVDADAYSGNVYNSNNEIGAVGDGSDASITGLELRFMEDADRMKALGFTEDKGWKFIDGFTPLLTENATATDSGKVNVSEIDRFDAGNVYYLSTAADVQQLAELVNAGELTKGVTFVLDANIDMSSVATFVGIGTETTAFKGDFYGSGYTISNLKGNSLFTVIEEATIRDVGLEGVEINIAAKDNVGSLVGLDKGNSSIINSYANNAMIRGNDNVGGLVGKLGTGSVIEDSYASSGTNGNSQIGGLVGESYGTVINAYASGIVNGSSLGHGGLIGRMQTGAVVQSSYSDASVTGDIAGGLVGNLIGGTITNSYSTGTVTGSTKGAFIGSKSGTCTLTGNYYNSASGANSAGGATGISLDNMKDQSIMESYGFTTDKGWVYYEGKTPQLRAESGENAVDRKVSLDTVLGKLADATVSKDLQIVVNGNTYSKTFNDNDTVEDVMNWLHTISDIDATYDETNCKFEVSADYADLSVTGGIANMLFGGNATTTLDQITVNTNSSYLIEPGAEEKITKDTVLKDLLPINTSATIGYLDETGKVVMQTFDNTKTIEDVMNYLNSKGFTTSIVDGVFTATKANGAKTDLYGTIGLALKGADGTTDSVGSGYVSEVLSSETSGTATGTTTLEELGVNSGDIHIKDAKGNILQTLIIDNQMTVNDVADLLSNYGITMTIDAGKITVEGENTKRIVDGSSNMVSQMKLNNWTGTEEKLTNTSTIAEMGFSNGAHLGIIMNGQVQAGYNFDADDTLADVIAKLESSGITASVDADGKFTATANGTFVLTDELGNYLTQDSANGYEKEANGYISSDPLEFFDPAELLTEDTLIGELLGTGQGGTLRLSLDSHQVVDLDYAATDTVRDIMTDLAGFGISTNITDGVLTAVSTDRTFKFDGDIGEAISGYNPRYEDLSTGYISKDLSYETKGVANYDSTLKELGISSGEIHLLSSDGKRISSLAIDESFTVAQVKSMLQPYNMELTMDANGKVTVSSPEGYKLTDGTSNMVSKMGLNNWTTTEEKLTLDTTVGQMGFKDGADLNLLLDGSIRNTLSFSADQTLQDIIFTLSAYGIDASVDADGKFTAVSKEHTFVMSSSLGSFLTKGTTGYVNDDTGYETYKPLEEEFPLITQTTEQLGYEKPMTLDSTLSSLGYENGGNVRLLLDNGTVHNLSFLGTDTVDEIVYALSAYGINADVVDGKFVAESVDNSFTISGNLGSYLVSGGTYQNEVTQYQNTLTYEEEVNVTNDTKLSDLGVTKGDLHVIKDGELQSSVIKITEDTTVGQFFNALKPYGLTGSILTDATTGETKIEIAGINTQLADGTSNVVSGLNLMQVRQGDFDGNVIYWEEDATSGLITEDMLISDFNKDGYIGQGSLIFETGTGDDAVQHIVNVTANETVGSLLKKFNDQGIKATLDNGIIKISAGLDGITFTGGTSGLINTLGLDIQNIDTYCESEVALTYTGDVEYSASNFADANTKLEIVNATNGVMSIFVDGVKCSIQVNTTDTFSDLFQRISSTVAARTGQTIKVGFLDKSGNIVTNPTAANNTGIVAMEIAEGHELVIGASNDTTNFATIANLNKTDYHRVEGSRALYKVNINSKITESGLFRDGNITMGTFTIGDAEFTIDENTTLKSLTEAISKSENSYATAYWDTLSGTLVIQSTLTGASLINIEAGTSNFTDILGFTKVNADGTKALVTENQKLGNNAVIRINGTTVTSSSNVITSDVSKIKGLTLNLKGVSEGETVTISVEQDREGIFNAVSDTIDSYNAMMDALGKELEKDDSLGNEIILKLMRNNLKRLMTSSLSGSYMYKNLSAIGISTGEAKDSTTLDVTSLMIDKDKFIDALTIDSDAVKDLLVGTTASPGIFLQANNIVESTIKADGYFSNMANSLSKNISKIEQKIQKANNSIETYKLKLERQFHNMELTITNMQSSYSNFLN